MKAGSALVEEVGYRNERDRSFLLVIIAVVTIHQRRLLIKSPSWLGGLSPKAELSFTITLLKFFHLLFFGFKSFSIAFGKNSTFGHHYCPNISRILLMHALLQHLSPSLYHACFCTAFAFQRTKHSRYISVIINWGFVQLLTSISNPISNRERTLAWATDAN